MNEETCVNCKHWRPPEGDRTAAEGECHGAPPIVALPPAIGRPVHYRRAAWFTTPADESCGGFAPLPRAPDKFEDTLEGTAQAETPLVDDPPQPGKKGKANAKA